jgi:hypothetical protein
MNLVRKFSIKKYKNDNLINHQFFTNNHHEHRSNVYNTHCNHHMQSFSLVHI